MKKITLLLALLVSFMIFPVFVKGDTLDDCVYNKTCLVLCDYENKFDKFNSNMTHTTEIKHATVYWDFKEKKIFFSNNKKIDSNAVHIQPGITINSSEVICPSHGYKDDINFIEYCFDNDGTWCQNDEKDWFTKFGNANDTYLSDNKTTDFAKDIENYFSKYSSGDITIDDLLNGTIKNADDIVNKMINDLKNNYLYGNDVPAFILNSNGYKNAVESIKRNFNNHKKELLNELEQKVKNEEISISEANNVRNILNSIDVDDLGDKAQNKLDTINGNSSGTLNVDENVTFCSSGVKKSFQVIGYIIYIAKIIIPLLLIILGSIDFAKAVISTSDKANSEAISALVRRIIIAVIIFLIPTILDFLLGLIDGAKDTASNSDFTSCMKCLTNPKNCGAPDKFYDEN